LCLANWIISFCVALPNYLGWGGVIYDMKAYACLSDRLKDRSFLYTFSGFFIYNILLTTALCYSIIFYKLYQSSKKISDLSKKSNKSTRLIRVLFLIYFTFALCWVPSSIIILYDELNQVSSVAYVFVIILSHLNSALNPTFYGVTNYQFRAGYLKFLGIQYIIRKLGKGKVISRKEVTQNVGLWKGNFNNLHHA